MREEPTSATQPPPDPAPPEFVPLNLRGPMSHEEAAELESLVLMLEGEGHSVGKSCARQATAGKPISLAQLDTLREIRKERAQKQARASPRFEMQGGVRDEARTREVQAMTRAQREEKFRGSDV